MKLGDKIVISVINKSELPDEKYLKIGGNNYRYIKI